MNEEREDTELAELLKQLPAPARLDDARRAAIFAALPEGKAPRKASFSWSRLVRVAALLVLVGGVLGGLLFPAGELALTRARKAKTAHASSMSLGKENADYSYCVVMDAVVDSPSDTPIDDRKPLEDAQPDSGAQNGALMFGSGSGLAMTPAPVATPAPPAVTAPAAAPAKPAAFGVPGSRTELPLERKREGDGRGDVDGFAKALAERSPELDLKEAEAPAPPAPPPAEMEPVAIVKSKIVMRGNVGSRTPGQRGRAFQPLERMEESASNETAPAAGDATASAAEPDPLPEPEMADKAEAVGMDDLTVSVASYGAKPARPASLARERRNAPQVQQPQSAEAVELPRQEAQEKVEAQLQAASDGSPMVAQDLAQAVDSDEDVYYTEGTTFKAKRLDAPERRLRAEEQEKQLASIARKADETLKMDQRESQSAILAELAKLENPRRELLDEYRKSRQKDLAKELPAVGSEAVDGADKEVLVEEPVEELKMIAVKPAPVDFGPFTLIPTAEHPLSTFGLDVDSAGYSRAVSMIDEGSRPEASAIRQEEFINAFDYGDLAPAEATFRVYLEGAASPFRPGNHLLRVGVKGRRLGREEQRPLRLTILLDASGSMETPERMALARRAIQALLATLSPGDTVTLLTCSDKTRRIFSRSGWGTDEAAREAETALGGIRCQGATNLEDGIVRAFESASADFAPDAENRVVILSDGIANLGSANAEEILAKVAANRDRGISCSVIGVGRSTYNDTLLEAMANRGNGQYRFLDSEASIHESFVEDLQNSFNTIAADVKIQVEWNAAAVKAYRSHGYDSRALKDEQFRDDSVDAGEVGSGQGVTVVYEMQLAEGLKPGATLGTVRIRYRRIDTGAVEEIESPIAAEAVQRDFVRARPQFRLACAVAEFATVLKHVPPAAQANALQPVVAEATRSAAELDYYAPARGFADAVRKLMGIGL
ncbi:MAG: von Willebrand factor type A domain-containing protein [Kiritimatiellae bacterium]|nr:von Willebrand factor type A domain-containing protein [Kiritimatiellia bacterium]